MVWYGMDYGAPPTPWTAIVATRWWQLDRAPAEHAQTESVPSIILGTSVPTAAAELRAPESARFEADKTAAVDRRVTL
jgi:hypothetical protein